MAGSARDLRALADRVDLAPTHGRRGHMGLTAAADEAGLVEWSLSVDSTIARAHQHATNTKRLTGGWIELQESA